jgi:hypothetical protein
MAFQIQMNNISGDGGGPVIRDTSGNGDRFRIGPDGSYDVASTGSGQIANLQTSSAILTGYNVTNLVTVIARGSNIYLYINQHYVASMTDTSVACGQIGVMSVDFTKSANIAYSHAEVWTF